ncbi:uncharacterized protein BCR38DRAFT_484059 [Pseudomassariella vexata]|uniref:DH domain-containing protein n=1 Tax=Pseudomassariella vexata TaxID=1141098 RepID=A0A1Y2E4E5_9PEZI|nr:uncharacterized protein BCR38DRAFT_484059 [Pseudomassariella vexata]ORY66430.1 hypothetical protein BCR38DRAFT_484059 [Pseudomassariella vexata]
MALLAMSHDSPRPCSRSSSLNIAKKSTPRSLLKANRTDSDLAIYDVDLSLFDGGDAWKDLDNITALGLALDAEETESPNRIYEFPRLPLDEDGHEYQESESPQVDGKPFHRWMKTLQKRARRPRGWGHKGVKESFSTHSEVASGANHRRSSSDDSFGYVTGVRSASVSLASASVMTRPRRNTARSSHHAKTDRSSRASMSGGRFSEDSMCSERSPIMDPAITERLLQRRRILDELIETEESYIGDIKFLMNVYVTILASLPTQQMGLRSSINRNLTDVVELHEDILGELHRVVPNSEYTQTDQLPPAPKPVSRPTHGRWRSLDSVPEDIVGGSWLQTVPGMTAEPDVAAEVAQVFGRRMNRFFVYEEYGAKYEMMIKDVASTHRIMPQWETYQKGLEALAASLGSANQHLDHSRKSLTIGDLLVKPIQRICKYPLLFAELLKCTPVYDCPNSHAEIENVLVRLREATAEINRATDDPSVKSTMEKTWLLQDRLVFPDQYIDATLKTTIRSLGQIQLCGALHICWQTREGVSGSYMVALLYKDCLCLATAGRSDQIYTIQACIGLDTIKIEEVDNGRGLQCHTVPFSWKLVFEVDHQLYEIIMTACSPKEELEWRNRLSSSMPRETLDRTEPPFCSSLSLNIKSLGTVFGKPGTVARRLSIHRATTVGPKSPLCQVILKNTTTIRDTSTTKTASPINRSQSLLTTNSRVPILAPPRADRARLEALLADVWSRDVLPLPGITNRSRSEHLVRSSASTMMRKLSVSSITNSFKNRSASAASTNMSKAHEDELPHVNNFVDALVTLNCDFTTPSLNLDEECEGEAQGRLPAIRDETERASSPSERSPANDTASRCGTVRRLDPSKLESQWQLEESQARPPSALRTSSANSIRNHHTPSLKSASPASSTKEKENVHNMNYTKQPGLETTAHHAKPVSKWTKVSVINRGLKTGGLRGFFR